MLLRRSGDAEDLNTQRPRSRAVELRHQSPLPLSEIDNLHTLIGRDDEHFAVNRQTADRRCRHPFDGLLAYGHGRAFAHAIPFSLTRYIRVPLSDTNGQCYEK